MPGKIFIISGPSGVGKDTIIDGVRKALPSLKQSISYTDRKRRPDDPTDIYHFISKEQFDELIKSGEIFEWEYARDERRYGSSKKEVMGLLNQGNNLIKIVGPKSFQNFKLIFGLQAVGIFLKYEDLGFLKNRLRKNRPDATPKEIEVRYQQALKDMTFEKDYDYSVINPEGQPEKAIEEVLEIIHNKVKD